MPPRSKHSHPGRKAFPTPEPASLHHRRTQEFDGNGTYRQGTCQMFRWGDRFLVSERRINTDERTGCHAWSSRAKKSRPVRCRVTAAPLVLDQIRGFGNRRIPRHSPVRHLERVDGVYAVACHCGAIVGEASRQEVRL